jgi:hypothetical protein
LDLSQKYKNRLSNRRVSGTRLLKPWFVAIGLVLIATRPIGALELSKTEFSGRMLAAQLFKPSAVIVRGGFSI